MRERQGVSSCEAGSAVADFVMVSALVTVLFMSVFQVAMALYVRNTLISCASEGARLGARAGSTPAQGVARTKALLTSSLSPQFAEDVSASVVHVGGVEVVSVRIQAPLPVVGPLVSGAGFDVVGRAFREDQ